MAKERRGTVLLIVGALVLLGVSGAIVYWVTHRNQDHSLHIFHWVPGPAPLKILDRNYEDQPEDMAGTLDPRLVDLLREHAVGGELRMITVITTPYGAGALLLQNEPLVEIQLKLVDRRAALYIEKGSGFAVVPEKTPLQGVNVRLKPDQPLKHFYWSVSQGPKGNGGSARATWW